jgi:1-aminocyclopropane-1-carboxylate deaminase/D-cysteine desulfhydrase-like pyridoxal-dependent ACC family enzyme
MPKIEDDDVIVFDQYLDPGYGVLTPEISRGIAALARSEGVVLDPVYTGKAWLVSHGPHEDRFYF